jgi:hypothetical protein
MSAVLNAVCHLGLFRDVVYEYFTGELPKLPKLNLSPTNALAVDNFADILTNISALILMRPLLHGSRLLHQSQESWIQGRLCPRCGIMAWDKLYSGSWKQETIITLTKSME